MEKKPRKHLSPLTIGLIVTTISVLSYVAWDLYKTRSILEFQLVSNYEIVDSTGYPEGFKIVYQGQEIKKLGYATFVIKNLGLSPITAEELKSSLKVNVLGQDAKIIDVNFKNAHPEYLEFHITRIEEKLVEFSFPLMNSKDQVEMHLLLAGGSKDYSIEGLIVGTQLKLVDYKNVWPRKEITATVIFALVFSLVLLGALVYCAIEVLEEFRVWYSLKKGELAIPGDASKDELVNLVQTLFKQKSRDDLKELVDYIYSLEEDELASTKVLEARILQFINAEGTRIALCMILALDIAGWWFVVSSFM